MDTKLADKLHRAYKILVDNDKPESTSIVEKRTLDSFFELAAYIALNSAETTCGKCDGCRLMREIEAACTAEIRKFVS